MNLVWFRNDLRLDDNPALYEACLNNEAVQAVYVATPSQWQQHDEAPIKLGFRSAALSSLSKQLDSLGIPLTLLEGDDFKTLPTLITDFCRQQKIKRVFFNRETPLHEQQRDQSVTAELEKAGIACEAFNGDLLVTNPVTTQNGEPYKVFTPWYRNWLKQLEQSFTAPLLQPAPASRQSSKKAINTDFLLPGSQPFRDDLWPATEQEGLSRLAKFANRRLTHYTEHRDYPAINGTSTLSPYLASGLISPRRCVAMIQQASAEQGFDWRESSWLRELAWREFYRYLMISFTQLSQNKPFKSNPKEWPWQPNPTALKAWQTGNTGFPIIDAAMRQLLQTGWMHNRLRMLTASFLCKLLLIDWHEGQRFFMQHLIDGDFASNNGGWQWSASTGCDASPWFRIFNPETQSRKFDADGRFIAKFIPELAKLDNKQIHAPSATLRKQVRYADPIIDYKAARQRALSSFETGN